MNQMMQLYREGMAELREENANLTVRIAELAECIGSQMADVYTLKARIAELETKIRHNALWQASVDAEERAHLEKLVPDLKKRIAELEAESERVFDLVRELRTYCIFAKWDNPNTEDDFNEFDVEVCKWLSKYMEREE